MGKFGKVENRHRISMNVNTLPFAIPASNLAQLVFEYWSEASNSTSTYIYNVLHTYFPRSLQKHSFLQSLHLCGTQQTFDCLEYLLVLHSDFL